MRWEREREGRKEGQEEREEGEGGRGEERRKRNEAMEGGDLEEKGKEGGSPYQCACPSAELREEAKEMVCKAT